MPPLGGHNKSNGRRLTNNNKQKNFDDGSYLLQKSRIYSSKNRCCVRDVLQRIKVTITVIIRRNLDS